MVYLLSTINTYIHLSILCYSLNSSQIELNYFTECLPYTAHPSRVRHVTTRTPSSFPLLASHERVVSNILSLISLLRGFGGSTQKTNVSFSKELLSHSYIECCNFRSLLQGTEKFAFCSDTFRIKVSGFYIKHSRPHAHFSSPDSPRQVRPSLLLNMRTLC